MGEASDLSTIPTLAVDAAVDPLRDGLGRSSEGGMSCACSAKLRVLPKRMMERGFPTTSVRSFDTIANPAFEDLVFGKRSVSLILE